MGARVAHCGRPGAGTYELRLINVPRWAAEMGVSEVAVLEAVGQLKTISAMDRRFKLPHGTAVAKMFVALEVPA